MEDLPTWAQSAGAVAIILSSTLLAVFKYFKTEKKEEKGAESIVAASILENKIFKDLLEELEDFSDNLSRENKKTHRLLEELKVAVQDNTEATFMQTDVYGKLVRMLRSFIRVNSRLDEEF